MEDFQIRALATSQDPPEHWHWYVDDSDAKMKGKEHSEDFLKHLNSIEEGVIEFTMELEEEGVLPVLDLKQQKKEGQEVLSFGVHYKKTHTNINVKKKSGHPGAVKKSIIQGFAERARSLCSEENLKEEMLNIEKVFVANGFERDEVQQMMKKKSDDSEGDRQEMFKRGAISVPYMKGSSEQYRKLLNNIGFRAAFRSGKKVGDLQNKAKNPIGNKKKNVVYEVECRCGCVYIGQTQQRFDERLKQHKDNVRLTEQELYMGTEMGKLRAEERMRSIGGGLVKHTIKECQQGIEWEKARPVVEERNWKERRVKETMKTLKCQKSGRKVLNQCDVLDPGWMDVLDLDYEKHGRNIMRADTN